MNFYPFHIGDYKAHTAHLEPMEDLVYRRIIDAYYLNERPFNGDSTDVARKIGLRSAKDEVEYVLGEFFVKNEDGFWINKRIEEEIGKYLLKRKQASEAGLASAKARSKRKSNARSTDVQPTNNQEPITKDIGEKRSRFVPPSISEVKARCLEMGYTHVNPEDFVNFYESKNWYVGKNKMKDWKASLAGWESREKKNPKTVAQTNLQGSKAHKTIDQIEAEERVQREAEWKAKGFESEKAYNTHLFNQQMARLSGGE